MCRNSFIKKDDEAGGGGEEQYNYDQEHDMITMNRTRKNMISWVIAIQCGNLYGKSEIHVVETVRFAIT